MPDDLVRCRFRTVHVPNNAELTGVQSANYMKQGNARIIRADNCTVRALCWSYQVRRQISGEDDPRLVKMCVKHQFDVIESAQTN
jgi:hypothetical protein